jgi:hypothetical protein
MATMQELWQVFKELKDDKQIRVVMLTGGEKGLEKRAANFQGK